MYRPFETVTDLLGQADVLRRRRHGLIEVRDGHFHRVLLRPLPKLVSLPEVLHATRRFHGHRSGDRFLLYYDQPWRCRNFLSVKYAKSTRGTSYRSLRRALEVLDEIARLKRTDALLCELTNPRLSQEMMIRWGWEPHKTSRRHRHFIKRFYGEYPSRAGWLAAAFPI